MASALPHGPGPSDVVISVFSDPTPSTIGDCSGQVIVVIEQVSPAGRADWSCNLVVE